MNKSLLIELRTEELPPKSLKALSESFAANVFAALKEQAFASAASVCTPYATPRRLALLITDVSAQQPDRVIEKKGPAVMSGVDAAGQPTRALEGFMRSAGVSFEQLHKVADGKAEYFVARSEKKGEAIAAHLAEIIAAALKKLPIPKLMRWGDSDVQFVRPVHGLIMLHGDRVVPGQVLSLTSGKATLGHRFMSSGEIVIDAPENYAAKLAAGKVLASFAERRAAIAVELDAKARELSATMKPSDALLDEVTALVEWPAVYVGEFESEYLEVPQECLILTMQQNQKYFPLFDAAGKLLNKFLIVSNMVVADPKHIVEGNARVVRPRLSDARFFYQKDIKDGFATRVLKLGSVVYHNKLGTLADRAQRLGLVAAFVAGKIGADANLARNAGLLCKVDLLTDMVGEFPELQGVMGRYYAQNEGAKPDVAEAMEHHYRPRFAGDVLPESLVSCSAALADKLDALVGFFGIGQIPTGDKDPFGLRRAALGVLRILMEKPLALDLAELIDATAKAFPHNTLTAKGFEVQLLDFMLDRLRGLLKDAGYAQDVVEAVLAQRPTRIDLVPAKLDAVRDFLGLPDALALAAANKRIGNILKKAETKLPQPDPKLFGEDAERALYEQILAVTPQVAARVGSCDYSGALSALASVRAAVDHFFDKVMVNVDDPALRANRLGLLKSLYDQLNAVADISKLGV